MDSPHRSRTSPTATDTALTSAITAYWDSAAPSFDDEPDHGLRDARTRAAWAERLAVWVPSRSAEVLDVGCGTGSLSLLLAGAGHRVTGVDAAPGMVARAQAKLQAAGLPAHFLVGDAMAPPTGEQRFDVLLSRHLLWTLPDPAAALHEWVSRLRPGGCLVLVEGRWRESAGADATPPYAAGAETLPWYGGVRADTLAATLGPLVAGLRVEPLSDNPHLWGGPVSDERYALLAHL
ncbi:class I SAM-dependent methyltransferase [Streptomyces sp. N2-109]|uniref:Class I SAM-dependent methyltransferase n=1 Tax=Streptomyces gossypii TaxID=2883101 RepID=A0ABT2JNT9_9ACTN|nr:class I SAM-dependent methyltransferase [Streptomyces gossypii]MCT2589486.1 class I SAM-dependent methyltransferase [Streptomyces gossypii]